jgi:uncharacterized protein YjbK
LPSRDILEIRRKEENKEIALKLPEKSLLERNIELQ